MQMVQSILAFENVGKTGVAGFSWVSPWKAVFFVQAPNEMIQVSYVTIVAIEI